MKKNRLNTAQLYNTLGHKQLNILNKMAKGEKCLIITYISEGEIDKRLKIGGKQSLLTKNSINTLISKGLFTMVNTTLEHSIIDIFKCELTNINKKLFKL